MTLALCLSTSLTVFIYLWGVHRYNRLHAQRFQRSRVAAFTVGIATMVLALSPPLDARSDASFAIHMVQHLALTLLAAPLLLLGAALLLAVAATPPRAARVILRVLHSSPVRAATCPVVTWVLFAGVMYGSHFSLLYETALEHPLIHGLEHAVYLGSALLFWQAVIQIGPVPWPLAYPLRLLYIFLAIPQNAFLGALLYESPHALYPHYVVAQGSRLAATADQQSGGTVMWIGGGLVMLCALLFLVASWAKEEERLARRLEGRGSTIIASLALLGALVFCAARSAAANQALISQGEQLYAVQCASCHGANLQGSLQAPPLIRVGAAKVDFLVGTGRMPAAAPGGERAHQPPVLTRKQIDALIAFVTSTSPGGLSIPRVGGLGNLQRGRTLFAANCAACHGASGDGGSLGYGLNAPALHDASETQIAEAIRIGPGTMPAFDSTTISDGGVESIIRYVGWLQMSAKQPGGFPLAGGPVTEGLVGWLFGLGALLIVIRLIGTKT